MTKRLLLRWVFAAGLFPAVALAQATAPDALIKSVTDEVLTIIRQDKEIQSGNVKRAAELIEQKVLPHFSFQRMTALAVGRDWRQASQAQRDTLVSEFKTLLVRTYSSALTQYRNETIDYKPFRARPEDTDVVVRTEVRQAGAKPVPIDYALEKNGGAWKVFDVTVAGVSLVTNYRESFAAEVRAGGIDGLIKSLQAKNSAGDTGPTAKK